MTRRRPRAALLATPGLANRQSGQASREYALVIAIVAAATIMTLGTAGLAVAGSLRSHP
jgi:Flp pilus assembly pilin Flp